MAGNQLRISPAPSPHYVVCVNEPTFCSLENSGLASSWPVLPSNSGLLMFRLVVDELCLLLRNTQLYRKIMVLDQLGLRTCPIKSYEPMVKQ
jgi:hypothetical protein